MGRPDEAETAFALAEQLRPDDAGALTLLGNLMQLRGAHREALDIYRRLAAVEELRRRFAVSGELKAVLDR